MPTPYVPAPAPQVTLTPYGLACAVREGFAASESLPRFKRGLAQLVRQCEAVADAIAICRQWARMPPAARQRAAALARTNTTRTSKSAKTPPCTKGATPRCGCACKTAGRAEVMLGSSVCRGLTPEQCQARVDRILAAAWDRLRAEGRV